MTQIKKTFGGQLEEKLSRISELNEKNASLESEIAALKDQATVTDEKEKRESELRHQEEKRNLEEKIIELENSFKNNEEKVTNFGCLLSGDFYSNFKHGSWRLTILKQYLVD